MSDYVMVRSEKAGVFAGYQESVSPEHRFVVLKKVRRIWYWEGAASLSQLAQEGTNKPEQCKFPCEVDRITIFDVVEILSVTEEARESIASVPVWEAKGDA